MKRMSVYGAGMEAQRLLPVILKEIEIEFILDQDNSKHGKSLYGIPIVMLNSENAVKNPVLLLLGEVEGAINCLAANGQDQEIYFIQNRPRWQIKMYRYQPYTSDVVSNIERSKQKNFLKKELTFCTKYTEQEYIKIKEVAGMPDYRWKDILFQHNMHDFTETGIKLTEYGIETKDGTTIKTMITEEEMTYLYFLAKEKLTGQGVIADMGPFYGSSTYCLLQGLVQNKNIEHDKKNNKIYSFDLFLTEPYKDWAETGTDTGSCFEQYFEVIKNHKEYVYISPGDICNCTWNNKKIEILFLDLSKSWDINDHVVKTFFPHLVPQHSILIQQDYCIMWCYWIHITMDLLKEYFVLEDYVATSAIYRLEKELPESIKDFNLRGRYTDKELISMHKRIVEESPAFSKEIMMLAHAKMLFDFGHFSDCKAIVDQVSYESKYATDFFLDYAGQIIVDKRTLQSQLCMIENMS